MVFDVATQSLKCPNCGTVAEIINDSSQVVEHPLNKATDRRIGAANKTSQTMKCESCGAIIEVEASCTATSCPYCGAPYVLAEKQQDVLIPDGVLPFRVDRNQVGEIFHTWIKKRWLAPGALRTLYQQDKLQGIYLPFWTFDAQTNCYYTAMGGRTKVTTHRDKDGNTHTETHTEWFFTSGYVHHFFDDVLVKASDKLDANLLARIEPYDTNHANSYSPDYFAGYQSECSQRDLGDAHTEARSKMERSLIALCEQDVLRHFDAVKNVRIKPEYRDETYKHVMLPVYATAYDFKGKMYTVLINGQTGKIQGGYPKSFVKIGLIVLAGAAAAAALLFAYLHVEDASSPSGSVEQVRSYDTAQAADAYETETVLGPEQYEWTVL